MSFSVADSLPHPPCKIPLLPQKPYLFMRSTGHISKIFVSRTVFSLFLLLRARSKRLYYFMCIAERFLLYQLSSLLSRISIHVLFSTRKIISKDILQSLISLSLNQSLSFVTFCTIWRVVIEFYGLFRYSEVCQLLISDIS